MAVNNPSSTPMKRPGTDDQQETIDLYEILFLFRQKIVFVLIALIIGGLAAGLITKFFITPKYSATAKIYIVSSSSNSVVNLSDLQIGSNLAPDYKELLKARPLLNSVIESLNLNYSVSELRNMLTIANPSSTRVLTITVTGTDPQESADIANAVSREAIKWLPEIMSSNAPNIYEDAIAPTSPSSPDVKKNAAIGALILALIYFAIEVIRYFRNDTITSAEQIEMLFGTIPLAVIPEEKGIDYGED